MDIDAPRRIAARLARLSDEVQQWQQAADPLMAARPIAVDELCAKLQSLTAEAAAVRDDTAQCCLEAGEPIPEWNSGEELTALLTRLPERYRARRVERRRRFWSEIAARLELMRFTHPLLRMQSLLEVLRLDARDEASQLAAAAEPLDFPGPDEAETWWTHSVAVDRREREAFAVTVQDVIPALAAVYVELGSLVAPAEITPPIVEREPPAAEIIPPPGEPASEEEQPTPAIAEALDPPPALSDSTPAEIIAESEPPLDFDSSPSGGEELPVLAFDESFSSTEVNAQVWQPSTDTVEAAFSSESRAAVLEILPHSDLDSEPDDLLPQPVEPTFQPEPARITDERRFEDLRLLNAFCRKGDYLRAALLAGARECEFGLEPRDADSFPSGEVLLFAHEALADRQPQPPDWCYSETAVLQAAPVDTQMLFIAALRCSFRFPYLCQELDSVRHAYLQAFHPYPPLEIWLRDAFDAACIPGLWEQVTRPVQSEAETWQRVWKEFLSTYNDSRAAAPKASYARRQRQHMSSSPEMRRLAEAVSRPASEILDPAAKRQIRAYLQRTPQDLAADWVESTRKTTVVQPLLRQMTDVETSAESYLAAARRAFDALESKQRAAVGSDGTEVDRRRGKLADGRAAALESASGKLWEKLFADLVKRVCP